MPTEAVGSAFATIKLDTAQFDSGMSGAKGKFGSFANDIEGRAGKMGSAIGSALKTGLLAAGVAIVAGLGGATKAFGDYEQGVADLNKIMGGTPEVQKKVSDGLRELSMESGTAVTSLLGVGASLSALGIGSGDVVKATKVIDQMGIALGINNDEAASYMAGMNTLYGSSVDKWSNLASGINEVENSTAATSKGMLNFANEFAPIAKLFNITDKEALAFGATMEALKLAPAEAATSLKSAVTVALADDKKMKAWADLLKTDVAGVKKALDEDLIGTLLKSAAALDGMTSSSKAAATDAIWGSYGLKSMALIGDATQSYTNNLATLNKGFDENVSIQKEVETRNNTLYGSWNKVKSGINDLGISLGEVTSGPLKGLMDKFVELRPAIADALKAALSGDWSKFGALLANGIKTGWAALKNLGGQLYVWLREVNWAGVGSYIVSGIKGVWKELESLGGQLLGYLQGINWNSVGTMAAGAFIGIGTTLYNAIAGINWTGLVSVIVGYLNALKDYWTGIATTLYNAFVNIDWNAVGTKISTAISNAISTLSNIGQRVWDYLANVNWEGIGQTIGNAINAGIDALKDIGGKIAKFISGHTWGTEGTNLADKIKTGIGTISGWASSIVKGINKTVNWNIIGADIGKAIREGLDTIDDYQKGLQSSFKSWIDSGTPKTLGAEIGKIVADAIKEALDIGAWVADNLNSAIKSVLNPDGGTSWATLGLDAGNEFCKGFVGSIVVALAEGIKSISSTFTLPSWASITGKEEELNIGLGDKQLEDIKSYWSKEVTNGKSSNYYSTSGGAGGNWGTGSSTSKTSGRTVDYDIDGNEYVNGKATGNNKFTEDEELKKSSGSSSSSGFGPSFSLGAKGVMKEKSDQATQSLVSYNGMNFTPKDFATALASAGYNNNEIIAVLDDIKANTKHATSSGTGWDYGAADVQAAIAPIIGAYESAAGTQILTTKSVNFQNVESAKTVNANNQTSAKSMMDSVIKPTITTTTLNFKTGVDGAATGFFSTTTSAAQAAASTSQMAAQANAATQIQATGYAATSLRIGAEIGAKFTTDAGQAVRLGGIDGRTAIIGGANQGAAIGINAANQQASTGLSSAQQQSAQTTLAATIAADKATSAASTSANTFTGGVKEATGFFSSGVVSAMNTVVMGFKVLAPGNATGFFDGGAGGGTKSSSSGTNNFNDCMFEGFTDSCTGQLVNPLIYTNPQGIKSYINPMTYSENDGIAKYIGATSSGNTAGGSVPGYSLPSIFAARGYLANQGPKAITVGERGTELVLPSDISRTIIDLTAAGGAKGQGVQEIHNHIHLNHREIAEQVFRIGAESMQSRGLSIR